MLVVGTDLSCWPLVGAKEVESIVSSTAHYYDEGVVNVYDRTIKGWCLVGVCSLLGYSSSVFFDLLHIITSYTLCFITGE
uniref:Uncharacterized protein n=1 Tax=Ciona intestinalis TaxID=7719 RepID=H2XSC2_CIOIN